MDFKLKKSDIYVLLLYFAFAVPINCFDYADYENKMDLVYEVLVGITIDVVCIYVIIFVLFPIFFPKKRYFTLLAVTIAFLLFAGLSFINLYCFFGDCSGNPMSWNGVYQGLVIITESFTIPGIFLLGKKLYDAQLNFIALEKEKRESELLRLNAQIDPHFLFNNLNTIDSLIDTNPNNAKIYLNKLSQLYRYLIASKDQEVVELEDELDFAQNYIYLIQSRFGDAFQFEICNLLPDENPIFVPPGALQTLLENAVKHNQASPKQPVRCIISITQQGITVSNNLIPKRIAVDSTGTGINNLQARYQLLTDQQIKITQDQNFTVTLPLIKQVD